MKGGKGANSGAIVVSVLGLLLTGADLFTTVKGWELCPYQGCRLAQGSPYASLFGIPLPALGLAFFIVALGLGIAWRRGLLLWASLGIGASLYYLYLQWGILGRFCLVCVATELLVLVLFLLSVTKEVPFSSVILLILLAFLALNSAYAWQIGGSHPCTGPMEKRILQKYYTIGHGKRMVAFFFSVGCPACARIFPVVREWAIKNGFALVLRQVQVHSNNQKRALAMFSLLREGIEPEEALQRVEKGETVNVSLDNGEREALEKLMSFNRAVLEAMGIEGVPTLVVPKEGKVEVVQGLRAIQLSLREGAKPSCEEENAKGVLGPDIGALCTPSGCE